jgi:hypothetical protein
MVQRHLLRKQNHPEGIGVLPVQIVTVIFSQQHREYDYRFRAATVTAAPMEFDFQLLSH